MIDIDAAFAPAAAYVADGRIPGATLGVVTRERRARGAGRGAWRRWCPSARR